MTAEEFDTLPNTGVYLVETAHSSYVIDTDAQTFERQPVHAHANSIASVDGRRTPYLSIYCKTGYGIIAATALGDLRSTPVASIVRKAVAA